MPVVSAAEGPRAGGPPCQWSALPVVSAARGPRDLFLGVLRAIFQGVLRALF